MPDPINIVPTNKVLVQDNERQTEPINNTINAVKITRSMPYRRASLGANGDISANANKGTVVSIPATAFVSPVDSRISPMSGPTDVIGAR